VFELIVIELIVIESVLPAVAVTFTTVSESQKPFPAIIWINPNYAFEFFLHS
jgi:hypothetical protein